jgi:hypothetical protein
MAYTLYNKLNKHTLVHPTVGLWYTNSIEEASDMYNACLEYLNASRLGQMIPHIVVVDAETMEEINLLTGSRSAPLLA